MKKNKKELENPYCDFSFFMKNGCNGCKRSKKCEEWYYATRIKRNRNYSVIRDDCVALVRKQKVTGIRKM